MEQSRASTILIHLLQLAGRAVARLRNDRELDRPNDHSQGIDRDLPPGSSEVSDRSEGVQRRDEDREPATQHVPWRLELRHQAQGQTAQLILLFINAALPSPAVIPRQV